MEPINSYALEKFTQAITVLATGQGDVRSRLYDAYMCIAPLTVNDLPDDLRADLIWIKHSLSKREPRWHEEDEGKLLVTLRRMRNKTGSNIAMRFVEIEAKLRDSQNLQELRKLTPHESET